MTDSNIDRGEQVCTINNQLGHKDLRFMNGRRNSTTSRVCNQLMHTILCGVAAFALTACTGPSTRSRPMGFHSEPSNRHPSVISTTSNEPVRVAAEVELG